MVVEDPKPISAMPPPVAQDVAADQAQIDQPLPERGEKVGKDQDPPAAEDLSYDDEDIDFEGTP